MLSFCIQKFRAEIFYRFKSSDGTLKPDDFEKSVAYATDGDYTGDKALLADVVKGDTQVSVKTIKQKSGVFFTPIPNPLLVERRVSIPMSDIENIASDVIGKEIIKNITDFENKSHSYYNTSKTETIAIVHGPSPKGRNYRFSLRFYNQVYHNNLTWSFTTFDNTHPKAGMKKTVYGFDNEGIKYQWKTPHNSSFTCCLMKSHLMYKATDVLTIDIKCPVLYTRPLDLELIEESLIK